MHRNGKRDLAIIRLVQKGWSKAAVARRYGLAKSRIDQILHPSRNDARLAVFHAVRRGELVRPDCCSECGVGGLIHAHHPDYEKPLQVVWLCPTCHAAEHRRTGVRLTRRRVPRTCTACGDRFFTTPGSARKLCSKACLRMPRLSDAQLLGALRDLASYLGRRPFRNEVIELGRYSHMIYFKRYGSYVRACELAGLYADAIERKVAA